MHDDELKNNYTKDH